ncbi:DUF177 domain-containing protein [Chloroflexota bacterium]
MNVAQLLKAVIGTTREYEIDESAYAIDSNSSGLARGKVKLTRTQRGILVQGRFNTEMELTCSRCLSSFRCPLSLEFEEEYLPMIDIVTGTPLSSPQEPGTFTIDENHILDLSEAVRQYTLLAVPMKPLCDEVCAGLCARCGANLNQGGCACPEADTDSRWAKLAQFKK